MQWNCAVGTLQSLPYIVHRSICAHMPNTSIAGYATNTYHFIGPKGPTPRLIIERINIELSSFPNPWMLRFVAATVDILIRCRIIVIQRFRARMIFGPRAFESQRTGGCSFIGIRSHGGDPPAVASWCCYSLNSDCSCRTIGGGCINALLIWICVLRDGLERVGIQISFSHLKWQKQAVEQQFTRSRRVQLITVRSVHNSVSESLQVSRKGSTLASTR
jgi:hypothetical protein